MRNVSCRGRPTAKAWKPLACGLQPECWGLWETLALSRSLQVLGLLVWALIADTPYHLYPAYGWVMFVAVFLWLVTIVFFILYLFQLHMKLYMVPWPLVLMIFNVGATVLYITAFITCSASVELTSLKGTGQYHQRAAASFFSCLVMIAYGVSAFFSFQAWRGVGSNAATSQMAGGYA
eukprot:bmy_12175T0